MIFTERKITITNNQCKIDSPVVLYRGDYNVEVRFTIVSSPYKYSNKQESNVIEQTEASFGQLVIETPNSTPIFSEITATKRGAITFTITAEIIDEVTEIGNYTFQIRLLDENKESRATIPEVVDGIQIRKPIATEDDSNTNEVGTASVGYALTTTDTPEEAFDAEGNYNKTTWATGDRITAAKLNKIEAGIDGVMDIYPFQPRAKFRHNKGTTPDCDYESDIRGLIKDIKLYNADKTKQYYIQAINRNVNNNYYIAIYNSDNVKVCELNTNEYTESELNIVKLESQNDSGIHGVAVVEWSKFKQNTGIYGMDYEETGLQIGVIADNDGVNLKDCSISKEKLTDDSLMSYPFQPRATFKHEGTQYKESIKKAIKDIHLYGAKPSKKYAVCTIWRGIDDARKYLIGIREILDDGNTTIVCEREEWYYQEPTGVDEFKLTERNSSGITASVYVDWAQIPLGDSYYNMGYNETGIDVRCCKDIIPKLPKIEVPNIILPQKIYATVGHELNIYYESVIDCDNVFDYKVDVEYDGPDARQLEECFRVTPNSTGNCTFTLKLYKYEDLVASKTCTISIVEDKTLGDIRGLYIGDSITEQNWYLYELQNMIPTFKSVGTRGDWGGLKHEGRSSWATTHYLNSASFTDKTNAFYNPSTSTFDFNYYMSNSSIETPNFVTIALGTNDAGAINADTLVANFNTMINSIRTYNPDMKIGITIAPPPAKNQDGWGRNNGVGATSYTHKKAIFEFAKKIIETFDNREDEGIYILPIYVNIDPVLDFPYEEVAASSRNTTVIKRGTDNVHPHKEGMYKISDIHYNWIKAIF